MTQPADTTFDSTEALAASNATASHDGPREWPPLMVCLDIDGTLLQYDGTMHDVTREAVRAAVDAGHHVVLSTGRAVVAARPILEMLGLRRGFVVCSNGAITLRLDSELERGYEVVDRVTFDPAPVLSLLRGQWEDAVIAVEGPDGFKVTAPFPDGELDGTQEVVSWEELMSEPVTRVTFRSPSGTSEDFLELADRIGLHHVNYTVGYTAWMDINPEGVSKASALELVRRKLEVEPANTVAVGDQRNDLEMLRWAARGVAMGQAPDEVKEAADEVTRTIEFDGAADVLRSLL